jgi:hypothetical protein
LWIPEESDYCRHEDDPLCESGMAQGNRHRENPHQVRSAQKEIQQGHKEPRCWSSNPDSRAAQEESTVAPRKWQGNKESRRQAAAVPGKEEDNRN